ncbi:MAG: TAXI family TRAP transporter solute-binding subunit [Salinarimonas sp.]
MSNTMKLAVLAAGVSLTVLAAAPAAQAEQLRIMTGPQGGVWYPLGGAFANIMGERDFTMQVMPGAGIANVRAVATGRTDFGFGNSISTVDGVAGRAPFDEPQQNVCNVATLYPQFFQIVALADAGVYSIDDMAGQAVAIQPRGNTAEFATAQALEVAGLTYDDLGRVSHVSYTDAVSLMRDNNAQVFTLGTTIPASSVMDLASSRDIRMIGMSDEQIEAMRELNPGYSALVIPAGTYPGQDEDVQTVGYATHIIARCDLDEDVVYNLLEGIVENIDDLAAIVRVMSDTTVELMAEDIGVPKHPGAIRFYTARGAV